MPEQLLPIRSDSDTADEFTFTSVSAINDLGNVVGAAEISGTPTVSSGLYPAIWRQNEREASELANLQDQSESLTGYAIDINADGVIVGTLRRPSAEGGLALKTAVRWEDANSAADALQLPPSSKELESWSISVGATGQSIGMLRKQPNSTQVDRVIRWDKSGSPTELKVNGTRDGDASPLGANVTWVTGTNSVGGVVGKSSIYDESGGIVRYHEATRWQVGSDSPEALLGFIDRTSYAFGINDHGTAVGYAWIATESGREVPAPVRWDAEDNQAVLLADLPAQETTEGSGSASAINYHGEIVGSKFVLENQNDAPVRHALYWRPNGEAIDLNSLIEPNNGWTLTSAQLISDTGWILGSGSYDADGEGGMAPVDRLFMLQIPSVPEPSITFHLVSVALLFVTHNNRHRNRTPRCGASKQ